MTVQGNGVTLEVTHKETVTVYEQYVWFRRYYITTIISLKKLIKKYQLTYDRINQISVVHREEQEKPNMEFSIHESRLHCYNPTATEVILINTLYGNKKEYPKSQLTKHSKQKIVLQN